MRDNKLHTPEGFRDTLPAKYAARAALTEKLSRLFGLYGYFSVSSPALEYIEVFEGKGSADNKSMYRFIDREGNVLALRPDMTPPISRIASTYFKNTDWPLRFCYFEKAFRCNESYKGHAGEFMEAGIELIGDGSLEADYEAVLIAIKSLLAAGLEDFRVEIGHAGFVGGLLDETGLDEDTKKAVRQCLIEKNYVRLEQYTQINEIPAEIRAALADLLYMTGGLEIFERINLYDENEKITHAVERLKGIYELIAAREGGLEKYIRFDLGMVGHLDYYTGIIMRGYCFGSGFSVLDGGRYDKLTAEFGACAPSVGFAIKIDNLIDILGQADCKTPLNAGVLLAHSQAGLKSCLAAGELIRSSGIQAVNLGFAEDFMKAYELGKDRKAEALLYFLDENVTLAFDIERGEEAEFTEFSFEALRNGEWRSCVHI